MASNICLSTEPLRKNRSVRFDFGGSTVLVACRGDQVSFNTTVDGNGDVHVIVQ
jgi:hypothetical protein